MEFHLIYEGPLPSNGSPKEKHRIRKEFHKQLAELWRKHNGLTKLSRPLLEKLKELEFNGQRVPEGDFNKLQELFRLLGFVKAESGQTEVEYLAGKFDKCGFNFVPLVNEDFALFCELDVLFLRRENPGQLVLQGGDIDNRLKTLFDALHVPNNCTEVEGVPEESEKPFYCLLEDDSLITSVHVRTDRLLTSLKSGQNEKDVILIIRVVLRTRGWTPQNMLLV